MAKDARAGGVIFIFYTILNMKQIILKKKRTASVLRRHPWVFSGAVYRVEDGIQDGDTVEVVDAKGAYLATGHFQKGGSIQVRLIAFDQRAIDQNFWNDKLEDAYQYRLQIAHSEETTNCYRLVHAEGDGLPGLIIDVYHTVAVVQCHSLGMARALPLIREALLNIYGVQLTAIYNKSKGTLPAAAEADSYLHGGGASSLVVCESGLRFKVDWETGQKTGFYIDQRENRQLLQSYVKDKRVLNAFCYSGGFSVYALQAGAIQVDSVDASAPAIALAEENIALNNFSEGRHQAHVMDVNSFLKAVDDNPYDVVVLDPPAYAKHLRKRHNAVQGYKRLNALAMKKIRPGGVLFTFSCSQVVSRQLFYDTIVAAALEAGRQARVLHWLSQPPDHPVNIFHPEGEYLKGLVIRLG